MEKNIIRLSSYTECRCNLLAVDGPILGKNILHISHRDIVDSVHTGCHRQVRSTFFLPMEKRFIISNPVDRSTRRRHRPITIPSSSSVRELLNNAPVRERIARRLGVYDLRIGETLAITCNDVSADWIDIWEHAVNGAIHEGLKRGVEHRVWMPRKLLALPDKSKLGTSEPLIYNQSTGVCFATSYGIQGVLVRTLNDYSTKRFHHPRRFTVSHLADEGIDTLKIFRLIGHSNIKTTMSVYSHLFEGMVETDLDQVIHIVEILG